MNPGAEEEAGKVALSFIDTMKQQPLALALVVVNLLFLGAGMWVLRDVAERTTANTQRQADTYAKLAETCVPAALIPGIEELLRRPKP
jgi:hypothetical protein